jgi:prepilin-type N-terminal cleavage/methylation domain-containing protein
MKNKGFTLTELIISIALISLVVVFLFRLFVDLEYTDSEKDYSRDNQQTRAIIIKKVQDDFLDYGLIGLKDNSTNSELVIKFMFNGDKTSTLKVGDDYVTYTNTLDDTEKWVLDKESDYMGYNINCVKYTIDGEASTDEGEFFYLKFSIPLKYKSDSQNSIDDLEFSYAGKKTSINMSNFVSSTHLGKYNESTCSY